MAGRKGFWTPTTICRCCCGNSGPWPRATPLVKWALPPVYEAYHRQLRDHRERSGGTREYIRILMLLKDNSLPEVTVAVEHAAALGI